jgi:uncharacterized damage-inducible protein DinB
MKELLVQFAAYNVWANKMITDTVLSLSREQQSQQLESSFPSLYATIMHIWIAESIWWQRIKLSEKINIPGEDINPSTSDAVNGLMQQSLAWQDWTSNASEMMLNHVYAYQNSKREQFKQPVYETLLHVFNHSTYHRGQLVTMMRALGIKTLPQTDFSFYCRKRKN